MNNLSAILVATVVILTTAHAEPDQPDMTDVSLEQAAKQVISNNNSSRVLSAKTEEIEGRKVHTIKMLTKDGHIQQQAIDADSGTPLDDQN